MDILGQNAKFTVQMLGPGDSGLPGSLAYASVLLHRLSSFLKLCHQNVGHVGSDVILQRLKDE